MAILRPCMGRLPDGQECRVPAPVGHCPEHPSGQKVYDDPRWRRIKRRLLGEHRRRHGPYCLTCDMAPHPEWEPAGNYLTLDHIVPLAQGGAAFDPRNLQVMCNVGNTRKSRRGITWG